MSWLATRSLDPKAEARLFCFPYAGGGASLFRPWAGGLPAGVDICPVELPGRGWRMLEPAFDRIDCLVEAAYAGLRQFFNVKFAFFGHSLGALVCFELARLLQERHDPVPEHLFVSACRAPQLPNDDLPLTAGTDQQFIEALQGLKGTPPEVLDNAELMELLLPTLRADFAACEQYVYHPREQITVPITAFGGLEDTMVTEDHLEPWREVTTASFELTMVQGDHFFLNGSWPSLLQSIRRTLCDRQSISCTNTKP